MDVQVIQHEMPLRRPGIAGEQLLKMGQGILLRARRATGWLNDVSSHDIEIAEPR